MLDLDCKICAEKNRKEKISLSFNVFIPGSKPSQQGTLFMINYSTGLNRIFCKLRES